MRARNVSLTARLQPWVEDAVATRRRVLTTVLFTDIVGSTSRAHELGDRGWADLLAAHHAMCRGLFDRFGGLEIDDAGDGFLAAFALASRALACARSLHLGVGELGLELRSGLHTGECELVGGRLRGICVHIGARIAALAEPGEVLVTATVIDVVQGVEVAFEDRGLHRLRGVPGERRLFGVRPSADRTATRALRSRSAVGVTRRPRTV